MRKVIISWSLENPTILKDLVAMAIPVRSFYSSKKLWYSHKQCPSRGANEIPANKPGPLILNFRLVFLPENVGKQKAVLSSAFFFNFKFYFKSVFICVSNRLDISSAFGTDNFLNYLLVLLLLKGSIKFYRFNIYLMYQSYWYKIKIYLIHKVILRKSGHKKTR